jgi:hypothetical protein
LALIPHGNQRGLLRAWSGGLFAAGLAGAWAFPWVVPLALLSRPLSGGELRDAAFALREANSGGDGKIRSLGPGLVSLPPSWFPGGEGGPALYGLHLDLRVPDLGGSAAGALIRRLEPPVLGAALVDGPEAAAPPLFSGPAVPDCPPDTAGALPGPAPGLSPPPPETAFRAAALANMIYLIRPAGSGGLWFGWKIGRLRWLPRSREKKGGA